MKKSVLRANALTIVDNQEILLENGSFSVYEGELLGFCQTSQSRFFFPELLRAPQVECYGILDYYGRPVGKKNPIRAMYISGPDMLIESMSIVDNLFAIRRHYRLSLLYNDRKAKAVLEDARADWTAFFHRPTGFGIVRIRKIYSVVGKSDHYGSTHCGHGKYHTVLQRLLLFLDLRSDSKI